ncbi:hypothetical protein GF325_06695 [Candidatus Bathyarchaeota archaeon]|nr:hypothetical protein [Candidatus Bathyarchaeota archaeon]
METANTTQGTSPNSLSHEKKKSKARESATTVYNLAYMLFVLGYSVVTILDIIDKGVYGVNVIVAFLKFTTVAVLLTRPFSMIVELGAFPSNFLYSVFPGLDVMMNAEFSDITDFNAMFEGFISMPDFVFLFPFVFYLIASIYFGYKSRKDANIAVEGFKFATSNYLTGIGIYVIIWGIVGIFNGFWTFPVVIGRLFVTWVLGGIDWILMIAIAIVLGSVGKWLAGKHPPKHRGAADYLVSVLQKPSPSFVPDERKQVMSRYQQKAVVQQSGSQSVSRVAQTQATVAHEQPPVTMKPDSSGIPGPQPVFRRYCEYCGARLDAGARFCSGCGVSLENIIVPEPVGQNRARKAEAESLAPSPVPPSSTRSSSTPASISAGIDTRMESPAREVASPGKKMPAVPPAGIEGEIVTGESTQGKGKKKQELSPDEVDELERKLHTLDSISIQWALVFMGLSAVWGVVWLAVGNFKLFAHGLLSLPLGYFAMMRDKDLFSKWIFERNYSSRGVDLIMWGAMGTLCFGSGIILLAKGILMLIITQNRNEHYPPLSDVQWQARVFQASTTIAAHFVILVTIANVSLFFELAPFAVFWASFSTFIGLIAFLIYVQVIKPEFARGNIYGMQAPLLVLGIVSTIFGGAGVYILIQGILISVQKGKYERMWQQDEIKEQPPT